MTGPPEIVDQREIATPTIMRLALGGFKQKDECIEGRRRLLFRELSQSQYSLLEDEPIPLRDRTWCEHRSGERVPELCLAANCHRAQSHAHSRDNCLPASRFEPDKSRGKRGREVGSRFGSFCLAQSG